MSTHADVLLHNGTIRTMVGEETVSCLALRAGKVLAAGTASDLDSLTDGTTRRVDLGGRFVLPGFNDAHVHLWKIGQLQKFVLDVRGVTSLADLLTRVRAFASSLGDDAWFVARGYNEALIDVERPPTRAELDDALGARPGLLIRTCAHIAVANTAALQRAGIGPDTSPPPGGVIERDATGQPTGILHESALGLVQNVIPRPSRAQYEEMILAGIRHQMTHGITAHTDPAVLPEQIEAYESLEDAHKLPTRVNLLAIRRPDGGSETLALPRRRLTEHLRLTGIKLFADGGLSGATAALRVPYRHADTLGVLRLDHEELFELAQEPHLAGWRIATHAIGDAAIDVVLAAYENLLRCGPGSRPRIEHFGLPDMGQLARARRLGVIAVPQAIFLPALGLNFRRYLPDDLLPRAYPLRDMIDSNIEIALSSDAPVVVDDAPLAGIAAALLRRDANGEPLAPEQALTMREALRAYTIGGAIASGDGGRLGKLAPGMAADFVMLERNPLKSPAEELASIPVSQTWVGGEPVYVA